MKMHRMQQEAYIKELKKTIKLQGQKLQRHAHAMDKMQKHTALVQRHTVLTLRLLELTVFDAGIIPATPSTCNDFDAGIIPVTPASPHEDQAEEAKQMAKQMATPLVKKEDLDVVDQDGEEEDDDCMGSDSDEDGADEDE